MASRAGGLLLVLLFPCQCLADAFDVNGISFESRDTEIYDTIPKMKIMGKGFSPMSAEIDLLELELTPALPKSDFKASVKDDNTIVLELAPSKRWPCSGEVLPATLVELKSASFKDTALPGTPVPIAKVYPTPVVYPATNIAYLTATPYLIVNGSNFNPKMTELYFTPPLEVGKDITMKVRSSQEINLVLMKKNDNSHRWAEEPGPLKISGIGTGPPVMKLRPDLGGVTICELQADLEHHGVSVETQTLSMYQSSETIAIEGKGFNPEGTKFRFANSIKEVMDYTAEVSETSAVLTLKKGRKWISSVAALPTELKLLAVDAGDGWVPVGANSAKSGRRVATIFEDPKVHEGSVEIMRTLSHELIINGTGFNDLFSPIFTFEPVIDKADYVVSVCNRTHVKLSLAGADAGWMAEGATGNLTVKAVNTGAGTVPFKQPVKVAMVRADADKHESGIHVQANYNAVLYQSSENPLVVEGEGFPEVGDLDLGFGGTNVPEGEAVKWERVSDHRLKLSLAEGHTWTPEPGPLFLAYLKFGETEVEFQSPGVKIATILEDPIVKASQLHVYATRTKYINIKGRGFASEYDPQFSPKVVLSPTLPNHFEVISTSGVNSILSLGLKYTAEGSEATMLPMWAHIQNKDDVVDMKVISIDTGAGPVPMPGGGIVVAAVRMDDDAFYCEDSCVYADDGVCDEDQGNMLLSGGNMSRSEVALSSTSSNPPLRKSGDPGEESPSFESGDDLFLNRPRCELGTDCTDCGLTVVDEGLCWNTCDYAGDEVCDDPRGSGVCAPGTDCKDCGAWETSFPNLSTMKEVPPEASDDDMGFLVHDPRDAIFEGQANNGRGRYHRVFSQHAVTRQESEEGGVLLKDFLWGAITLVGVIVTGVMGVILIRFLRGEKVDLPIPTNPDVESRR